ncbi:Tex family protein [Corynebacterium tapiri]|uniref:RNA-binding transcriptional accessory protein n=1 Tax=Corynebacterium tapiri TaxID=1448266 RepID=A0A5C4U5I6_9CORY|nr:Tex family protein [Corynebacterium tapiri]TNL99303.1 RNA-binding transcriptional accessory protein [Corynebacterium tapiri]
MISQTIAAELNVRPDQVSAALELLASGNTVPFIARYRKEATGGLDDGQLRHIETRRAYLSELAERKETVLAAIAEQNALTEELRTRIEECDSKARLEDIYAPYKKRRKTKADVAREAGLEELLEELIASDDVTVAKKYLVEGFATEKEALNGARAILIDRLAMNADLVGEVRETMFEHGTMRSSVVEGQETKGAKFKDYFDFSEPFDTLPSHRILALLRGEAEGVLSLHLDPGEEETYEEIIARHAGLERAGWVKDAMRFGWRTKLLISAGLDVRMRLKERAEEAALEVFATNLRDVLLAAPAGERTTLGLDPGYRNGVKCAVVDATGKVLDTAIVYPHQPQNKWDAAVQTLTGLCTKHAVDLVAVGNGTASRETDRLARELPATAVTVSESGASVYSASEIAAEEFPDMDVSLRGAVSIARRLQDPLAELVKIDPKSIGVGQYQHDINQTRLATTLDAVVEDAVNAVGVDVNTASAPLLARVAGVSGSVAHSIVAHRDEHGAFRSRTALLDVPRLGPKAFEQCAGFLRIPRSANPLDASGVHPESYAVVDRITAATGLSVERLIGNSAALNKLRAEDFADEQYGVPTVSDIIAELDKPGRDPRPEFRTATFHEGVHTPKDLKPGMRLEGTVTNVAAFGAFVDIGVHQDGLVHVSQLADTFVKDPHAVVRSGQVVQVRVLDVDVERNRISLSMRSGEDKPRTKKRQPKKSSKRDLPNSTMAQALRGAGF